MPRGACSECGRDVALRRGGLVREHVPPADTCVCGHADGAHGRFRRGCLLPACSCGFFAAAAGTCPGSGQLGRTA